MTHNATEIGQLLDLLQSQLTQRTLWESTPPAQDAFASTLPFCHDRMAFNQWLQWIFIPKINRLLEHRQQLPGKCEIAPMAEVWSETEMIRDLQPLIETLQQLDRLLSA